MRLKIVGLSLLTVGLAALAAPAAAAPIEAYGALPTVERPTLSPSGKLVALFYNQGDKHIMVVRRLDGDHGIVRTSTLNDRVGGARWADDDHLYVSTRRTFGTGTDSMQEGGFLFLINLKTKSATQVVPDEETGAIGLPTRVVHQGGHVYGYFEVGRRLYRQDIDTEQLIVVARSGENQGEFVVTPDAEVLARMERLGHGRKWSVLKGVESSTVLASGEAEIGGGELLGLGRTPQTVLVADNENGTLSGVREIDLKTGKVSEPLVQGAVDVQPFFDRTSFLLLGFYIDGFVEDYKFLDPDLERAWLSVKAAFKDQVVRFSSFNDDRSRWIVQVEGPHNSGEYYLVDVAQHRAVALDKRYPDIKPSDVGAFSWFDYKAQDGTPLKALLTLPPGYTRETAKNLPVAVLPHGGPQGRDSLGFDWWGQALASRGYVVIQPEFRGSGGFGRAFEEAGWGQWGKLMQTDVSDAFDAVAKAGLVDPKRACIVGWSYGGYATMAAATLQPGLYRCAAAGAGIADVSAMLTWEGDRESGDRAGNVRYWRKSMGVTGATDPKIEAFSPVRHVAALQGPFMLIHGRDDITVPLEQSELMAKALKGANKPYEFVILENETHHLESASTRTKMLKAMIGFLERYNPPTPSAAPVAAP